MANSNSCCNQSDEKLLTESSLKYLISKLTNKVLLAVGVIKTQGDEHLTLKKENTEDGILISGSVDLTDYAKTEDLTGYAKIENVYKKLEPLGVLTIPTIAFSKADCDGAFSENNGVRTVRIVFDCDFNLNDYETKKADANYQDKSNPGLIVYNSSNTVLLENGVEVVEGDATADRDSYVYSMSAEIVSEAVAEEIEHAGGVWICATGYYNLFNPVSQYASHVESANYIHVYMDSSNLYTEITDKIG